VPDLKVSQLATATVVTEDDYILFIDNPSTNPASKIALAANVIVNRKPSVSQTIVAQSSGIVPLSIKGAASQSSDLLDLLDSAGNVLLNVTAGGVINSKTAASVIAFERYAADAVGGIQYFRKSRHATIGSHTIVQNNDILGEFRFNGSDGSAFQNAARIMAQVDGVPSGDMPGRLCFYTTPAGSSSSVEYMRLGSTGQLLVGSGASATIFIRSTSSGANLLMGQYSADAIGVVIQGQKSRNATIGGQTIVQNGDALLTLQATGSDGSAVRAAGSITFSVDGVPGASDMPGRISFSTTPDGSAAAVERMRISNDGTVRLFDVDLQLGTTTGTKIGTGTTQKIGFFGATPIVQGTAFTQTYTTATHTHAADTTLAVPAGGTGTAAGGWDTAANRDAAINRINALRTDYLNTKQVLNGLIDDLQALGLIG
jgi:hypothetical protein